MQKTILKRALSLMVCLAVLIAGMPLAIFNVGAEASPSTITDNFDGENNWSSLTSDASPINAKGRFAPATSGSFAANKQISNIYTRNDWPTDRQVSTVEMDYYNARAYATIFIYDYKDENNFRGFYFQKATNLNVFYFMKETDPENPNKVYFHQPVSFDASASPSPVDDNTWTKLKFIYGNNNDVSVTITNTDATNTKTFVLPTGSYTSPVGKIRVSEDGGATFVSDTQAHTFAAIEDVKASEFALGSNINSTATPIDNLVINFEKTNAEIAEDFKTTHAAILAKTIGTVTADDKAAIAVASADYEALSDGTKAMLADEYKLLGQLKDAIISGSFNVSSFTDDFSGDNYWIQVGDGAASSINNGQFQPGKPTDIVNGKNSVHVHKYWPNRNLKSVTGTMFRTYRTSVAIYYYKDPNNWRGVYFQGVATSSNWHLRYIMKESDPSDPNKVYYYYADANDWGQFIYGATGNYLDFNFEYLSDTQIKYTATVRQDDTVVKSNSTTVSSAFSARLERLKVSTDGGKTFSAASETYTFSAIADAKSSKFGLGYSLDAGSYFDDIAITFEKADAEYAAEFKDAHKDILDKTAETVAVEDKEAVEAALAAYEALSDGVKALVANEYALLGALSAKIAELELNAIVDAYKDTHKEILAKTSSTVLASDKAAVEAALADFEALSDEVKALLTTEKALLTVLLEVATAASFDAATFTDDFSGDNNWVQVGSGTDASIVSGEFYPGASTNLTGNISVHTHKYWPARQLKKVSGSYRTAALSSLMIYYYKDANNWRGVYSHNGSSRHFRYVMKATDAATGDVYFWYSNKNDIESITSLANNPMAFEIIYENDTTIKLKVNGQERVDVISGARTSIAGQTFVSKDNGANFSAIDGTYTFPAITDAKSAMFAMGNGQNASRFDNLTFNFEESTANLVAAYLDAHKDILAKDVESVVTDDKAAVDAALADYAALSADAQALVADEYAILCALKDKIQEIEAQIELENEVNKFRADNALALGKTTDTVAVEDKAAVEAALADYALLSADAQAVVAVDYALLGALSAKIAEIEAYNALIAKVEAYKAAHAVILGKTTETVEIADEAAVDAALADYAALGADAQALVADEYAILGALKAAIEELKAKISEEFEEFEETFTIPDTEVSADNLADIDAALELFETLTPEQQANYAEEKAALEQIKVVATFDKEVKNTVVTPANVDVVAEKQAAYDALGVENASIDEAIKNLNETVNSFSSQVKGCSIKTDADPTKQDLRFEYAAPKWEAPKGWYVKEYGAIFYPAAALKGQALTLETPYIATGKGELNPDGSVPTTFRANLVGSALETMNCAMDIAGTAYVIWTDGTNEYVRYSNNEVDNNGYTESGVANGIGVRSVYKTARKIASAIYGKEAEYGTVYTEAVTAGGDLASFRDEDILAFVAANKAAVENYVGKNQGK